MRINTKAIHGTLGDETREMLEAKLAPVARLLGEDEALLEVELEKAPAQGRSSEPYRLVANLSVGNSVFHAEAVKPTAESAADKVRSELESGIRRTRGRSRELWRRGRGAIKNMLRFGR